MTRARVDPVDFEKFVGFEGGKKNCMKYSLRSISTRVWLGRWQFNWLSSRGPFVNRKRTETKMARSYSLRWACHCVCDCIYVRVYECAWSFDRNVSMHGSNFANRRSRRCGHLVSGHETTDTTHRIVLYFEDRQFHGNSILRYRSLRPTTELSSLSPAFTHIWTLRYFCEFVHTHIRVSVFYKIFLFIGWKFVSIFLR